MTRYLLSLEPFVSSSPSPLPSGGARGYLRSFNSGDLIKGSLSTVYYLPRTETARFPERKNLLHLVPGLCGREGYHGRATFFDPPGG